MKIPAEQVRRAVDWLLCSVNPEQALQELTTGLMIGTFPQPFASRVKPKRHDDDDEQRIQGGVFPL